MDAFDPKNDLIDRYLRGELQGKQLDDFIRSLEQDASLKKEIEFRTMLVRGIQDRGSLELKNYIRQKTTQKRGLFIGFRSWYYAAAAVGLVLVSSVVILMNLKQHEAGKNPVAKEVTLKPEPTPSGIPSQPEGELKKEKAEPQTAYIQPQPETDGATSEQEGMSPIASSSANDAVNSANIITIASNIQVVPIRIESPIENVTMSAGRQGDGAVQNPSKRKKTKTELDSGYDADMAANAKDQIAIESSAKFRLNFYNTKDATPQVSTAKKDPTNTEIMVFNLPYDNPLLFTYKNKMYLKTGKNFYEIDVDHDGTKKVSPVTDKAVLKALDQ